MVAILKCKLGLNRLIPSNKESMLCTHMVCYITTSLWHKYVQQMVLYKIIQGK